MSRVEVKHEKCGRCKCWKIPEEFLNEKGRRLKTCSKCRWRSMCHKRRKKEKQMKEQGINYDSDYLEKQYMLKLFERSQKGLNPVFN